MLAKKITEGLIKDVLSLGDVGRGEKILSFSRSDPLLTRKAPPPGPQIENPLVSSKSSVQVTSLPSEFPQNSSAKGEAAK